MDKRKKKLLTANNVMEKKQHTQLITEAPPRYNDIQDESTNAQCRIVLWSRHELQRADYIRQGTAIRRRR